MSNNKPEMTINDLINRIYSMNEVKDEFNKEYLERVRTIKKITWYPSSGFDLRPLDHIFRSDHLRDTIIVYSDIGAWFDNYKIFMNISEKINQGILSNSDMPPWFYTHLRDGESLDTNLIKFIRPFKIFTNDQRKSLIYKRALSYAGDDVFKNLSNQEYDGFFIQLGQAMICFLCMDDLVVEDLFEVYNIDVVCLFMSETGGCGPNKRGNLVKNIKYFYKEEVGSFIEGKPYGF